MINIYDGSDNSSSDPEFSGKHGISRKVKANKLLAGSEVFIKSINNSVVSGLSMNKTARLDLGNLIKNT